MTELRLPPLAAEHSQLWLQVDLSTNQDWAWRAAAQLLARPQWAQYRTQAGEKRLTARMRLVRTVVARRLPGPALGFILVPSPEDGIKGMATLSAVGLDGQTADDAIAGLVRQLAARFPAADEPEITRMQTPAGECRRLRTQYTDGDEPGSPGGEQIGYVWVPEDSAAAWCLLMSFTSLPEAARWLPALDELASGVRLQRSPQGPGPATPEPAAAGAGGGIEVRPVRPDGRLYSVERAALARWMLAADPHFGTLTLSGDRPSGGKPQVFQLPSTGQPGAVTTVCLATHHWEIGRQSGSTWRMLFLDRENRLAGSGSPRDYWRAVRLFPPEVFGPLKAAGINVVSEWYDSAHALEDAYPAAAGKAALIGESRGRLAAIGLGSALVIFIVVAVAVYLSTH